MENNRKTITNLKRISSRKIPQNFDTLTPSVNIKQKCYTVPALIIRNPKGKIENCNSSVLNFSTTRTEEKGVDSFSLRGCF